MKVWVVVAHSESGDQYVNVFGSYPTEEEITEAFTEEIGDEWEYCLSQEIIECKLI